MAVQVHVENFQSLRDTGLEIRGFTAVTGPNNSGKTALMRAIRGVFQNTPGTTFVRHGADEMSVTLKFDDGRSIIWKKGTTSRSKPTYIIDGGNPIHPGRAVPDEVRAFGVTPIRIMGQEVWPTLAPQFTGQVFLLDQPGSSLAEAVADVDRVAKLNGALRSADRDLRATTGKLKVRREDRIKLLDDLQAFDGLDTVVAQIEAIKLDREKVEKLNRAMETMTRFKERLEVGQGEVRRLSRIEDVHVPDPGDAQKMLGELEVRCKLRSRREAARAVVQTLEGIEAVTIEELDTQKASAALSGLEFLENVRMRLTTAQARVTELEAEYVTFSSEVEQVDTEVRGLLGQFERCPTCGTLTKGHEHGPTSPAADDRSRPHP